MKYKDFIKMLDSAAITRAVKDAEANTAGEICVCISRRRTGDALGLAKKLFRKFKMEQTAARTGVILLVAPESQKTAIYGDEGIDRVAGSELWNQVIGLLNEEIPVDPTLAITDAVKRVGEELAKHFPRLENDVDELSNEPRFDA